MLLSREWLSEFVDVSNVNDHDFSEDMTLSGSKVETVERQDAEIKNIVVGKIVEMVRHENSDHMWVCQIDVGAAEPVQIVTGAQNQKVGDFIPVCLDGAVLPGGKEIHAGALRGVMSNGMCCSYNELGMDERDWPHSVVDGLFILQSDPELAAAGLVPGTDITKVLGLDNSVVEFEITPNRPDCLSVIGLAREVSATYDVPCTLHTPVVKGGGNGVLSELLHVETPAADLCPRYTARMVRNVKIAPSPKWMRERLRAMGVRPINNIVDITNYVMLEYGQPMHAFDYRYVQGGKIIVRRAAEGEKLTTLDGKEHTLTANHLVIADDTRAVGLAGIMGGLNSEIAEDTVDVVFESANFNGTCIRKGALALGMRTEASAKFEKGLDIMNTLPAVERACELVEMLGAGEVLDGVIDIVNAMPEARTITMDPARVNALLGTEIDAVEMYQILERVDIVTPEKNFPNGPAEVCIPSWRGDVEGIADLAEEVARFYGYNNIPNTLMRGQTTLGGYSPAQQLERRLGELCRSFGHDEIITYSFISPTYYDKIRWPEGYHLRKSFKILNPLGEDTSIMRTTVLPSMLEILTRNYNFRNKSAKLYEIGRIYLPGNGDGLATEAKMLSIGAYGPDYDFFTMKGVVEAILTDIRAVDIRFEAANADYPEIQSYHPGRCATVWVGSDCIGHFGQIHPLVCKNYDVDTELYCAELSFDELMLAQGADPEYTPLPRFPASTRDLSVVCDEKVTVGELASTIKANGGKYLECVEFVEVYRGAPIQAGQKSVTFSLTLRAEDQTLTVELADETMEKILLALKETNGAEIR